MEGRLFRGGRPTRGAGPGGAGGKGEPRELRAVEGRDRGRFPENPDAEAAKIRKEIQKIAGKNIAVILADTELVPYGTIDIPVGSSGIDPCPMVFGKKDKFGRPKFGGADLVGLEMTAASALLFGQTDSGIPVTIIRGYEYQFNETKNISSAPHYSGNKKEFNQILRGAMKATSYAANGLGKKLLLRIGSWFVR